MSEQTLYQQVTIGSYPSAFEANLACAALKAEGIESYLEGEHFVETLWHYTTAVGGIKLQVAASSQETARRILEEIETQRRINRNEREHEPESLESQVNRALKQAVLGIFFFPVLMHFYSIYTLRTMSLREVLDGSSRIKKRFFAAYAINLMILIPFFMMILYRMLT